jgi:hypothetical protein
MAQGAFLGHDLAGGGEVANLNMYHFARCHEGKERKNKGADSLL